MVMVRFLPAVPSGWSGLNFLPTLPVSVKALPAFSRTSPEAHICVSKIECFTTAATDMAVMHQDVPYASSGTLQVLNKLQQFAMI